MSLFITFEGGEEVGKSTQAKALFKKLSKVGCPVVLVKEPGSTPLGRALSRQLKQGEATMNPLSELFLFAAARAQLTSEVIRPALDEGKIVISDRFADSTVAYQGYGRGLDFGLIEVVNNAATGGLHPTLVILLDAESEQGLQHTKLKKDRFEREALPFHRKVREGYLKMAAQEPERWLVVDASKTKAEVTELIWERVQKLLG
jgi:dTMP kinase